MSTLVTLARYEQPKTAYFLKQRLENENIDCFFEISFNIQWDWEIIRVQVHKENVRKAIRVMLGIKEKYGMVI